MSWLLYGQRPFSFQSSPAYKGGRFARLALVSNQIDLVSILARL